MLPTIWIYHVQVKSGHLHHLRILRRIRSLGCERSTGNDCKRHGDQKTSESPPRSFSPSASSQNDEGVRSGCLLVVLLPTGWGLGSVTRTTPSSKCMANPLLDKAHHEEGRALFLPFLLWSPWKVPPSASEVRAGYNKPLLGVIQVLVRELTGWPGIVPWAKSHHEKKRGSRPSLTTLIKSQPTGLFWT